MPGAARMRSDLLLTHADGAMRQYLEDARAVTEWFGPHSVQVATATTEQSITALLTQGLTTITTIMIKSDQNISVTYGTAGNNEPVALNAGGFHVLSGTSLTAVALSNSSGSTANVLIWAGGS